MLIVDISTSFKGIFMNRFFNKLTATSDSLAPLILRVTLGGVMLPHGLQKTLGLFGGHGFSGTMGYFTSTGMPWIVAFLVIIAESLGALGLILGFLSRFTAASYIILMIGAISMGHFQNGFFMNWYGNQAGEGFEYHLLVIGISLSLIILGSGKWSIDKFLNRKA